MILQFSIINKIKKATKYGLLKIRKENTQEIDTETCLKRADKNIREQKKSKIRGMSQTEFQKRADKLLEHIKELLKGSKS